MHLLNNIVAFPYIDQCKFERFYFGPLKEFDTGEVAQGLNKLG